jgi:uncharacterized membrane protein YfcA
MWPVIAGQSVPVLLALAMFSLLGGIGITAIGPGGVLPTIGLFTLTALPPAEVAGTAIVTHVATGALATAVYVRSGHLREPAAKRTAAILAGTAVIATPAGVWANTAVSSRVFGLVLGVFLAAVAVLVWLRERPRPPVGAPVPVSAAAPAAPTAPAAVPQGPGVGAVAALGIGVGAAAGLVGVGGPMLTVPLLVVLGVPLLRSLAAAQVQSVAIAGVGTLGYLAHGTIDPELAAVVGVPELAGVLIGGWVARTWPTHRLKNALVVTMLVLAPYLALHG